MNGLDFTVPLQPMKALERDLIHTHLVAAKYNVPDAAKTIGLSVPTVYRRLRIYGWTIELVRVQRERCKYTTQLEARGAWHDTGGTA